MKDDFEKVDVIINTCKGGPRQLLKLGYYKDPEKMSYKMHVWKAWNDVFWLANPSTAQRFLNAFFLREMCEDYNVLVDFAMGLEKDDVDLPLFRETCRKYKDFLDDKKALRDKDNVHYRSIATEFDYEKRGEENVGKEKVRDGWDVEGR